MESVAGPWSLNSESLGSWADSINCKMGQWSLSSNCKFLSSLDVYWPTQFAIGWYVQYGMVASGSSLDELSWLQYGMLASRSSLEESYKSEALGPWWCPSNSVSLSCVLPLTETVGPWLSLIEYALASLTWYGVGSFVDNGTTSSTSNSNLLHWVWALWQKLQPPQGSWAGFDPAWYQSHSRKLVYGLVRRHSGASCLTGAQSPYQIVSTPPAIEQVDPRYVCI